MEASGKSLAFWEMTGPMRTSYPALRGDMETDVVVVGAGITGLTAAILLLRQGRSVMVIEKERVGFGTSGRNSAHLTTVVDFHYSSLIDLYGIGTARRVARSLSAAIQQIEQLQEQLHIDCDFARVPGYLFAEEGATVHEVDAEFEACKRCGIAVERQAQAPLPFPTEIAFRADNQAEFHPLRYLHGLAAAFCAGGGTICEGTAVRDIKDNRPCLVKTDFGTIRAQEVILATHTPLGVNPVQTKLEAYRSFVMAVKITDSFPKGLFWDTAEPYNYLRSIEIDKEQIIIIGGHDHKTGVSWGDSFKALDDYAKQHFSINTVLAKWSAQLYNPTDSLPFIGKSPFSDHSYIATGFSGDGLTFGTLAGMLLANLISQGHDEYDDLYHPGRIKLAGLGPFLRNNLSVARHIVGDRFLKSTEKETPVGNLESGRVIREGNELLAIYRDAEGTQTRLSAVCPHMKCVVRWNDGERSWDCPCHGSRFDQEGKVIEGPAYTEMEKREATVLKKSVGE